MNARRKTWTVATFEFLTAVKRPGYLIATFGMPLFMAAYAGIVAIPAYFASRAENEPSVYAVVDTGGLLDLRGDVSGGDTPIPAEVRRALDATGQTSALEEELTRSRFVFRPFPTEAAARDALARRIIKGTFVVPPHYVSTGVIDIYTPDAINLSGDGAQSAFASLVRRRLLSGRVDENLGERIARPLQDTRQFNVTRTGEVTDGGNVAGVIRVIVPIVFMVLFLISVLMTSGYLLQGTATEKENKVVDVLVASADPEDILFGKLLGLGGAGLLQIAVWLVLLLAGGVGIIPLVLASHVAFPWMAVALAIPLFLVAFLFFGSLMLGTGSLGSNMREAQQLAMVWSLTAALPMMMTPALLHEPHGTVARVLTWLPFSSAPVIIFRASTDASSLAWWEVAGAFTVLVLSTWIAIRLGARLFRIGLLSASRPKLREVIRQARLSA
jgi:ABC-2 type transport system permease protein